MRSLLLVGLALLGVILVVLGNAYGMSAEVALRWVNGLGVVLVLACGAYGVRTAWRWHRARQ